MNWDELFKMVKEASERIITTCTTGTVISISPLKIKWMDNVIIQEDKLILADLLKNGFTVEYLDDNGITTVAKTITIKNPLQMGDEVIMIPDADYKKWYVIDKKAGV